MTTQIDRVPLPMTGQISERRISKLTFRQKGLRCILSTISLLKPVNGSYWKWAMCTVFNQKWLKDEEELQASGCKLTCSDGLMQSAAALLTVSQKQFCGHPGISGNKCNNEGISQVMKTVKDWNCSFWQGDKGDTTNSSGTDRRVEIGGNNTTQKSKCIPNWTLKILAIERYLSRSTSGFRKKKRIFQWSSE